mmetsp:Transcript_114805/g.331797  ORF Transcript_114805/g.331797 Transcript_114805/m.331797 type:complete len:269 (+) Transcript_114805:119-925(+)
MCGIPEPSGAASCSGTCSAMGDTGWSRVRTPSPELTAFYALDGGKVYAAAPLCWVPIGESFYVEPVAVAMGSEAGAAHVVAGERDRGASAEDKTGADQARRKSTRRGRRGRRGRPKRSAEGVADLQDSVGHDVSSSDREFGSGAGGRKPEDMARLQRHGQRQRNDQHSPPRTTATSSGAIAGSRAGAATYGTASAASSRPSFEVTSSPADLPTPAPVSIGSVGHPGQCGPPCKYVRKARGCKDGAACRRCHLCKWSSTIEHDMRKAHP